MDISYCLANHQPKKIVSLIRNQLFEVLNSHDDANSLHNFEMQIQLVNSIEKFCVFLCGNFYLESTKDNFEDFQLEREFISQEVLGYFIANLEKLDQRACKYFLQIFTHLLCRYAYRTKRPLLEILEYKGQLLLERLCLFLNDYPEASYYASEMLCLCCDYKELAQKLIDLVFHSNDDSEPIPFYIKLLHSIESSNNFHHLNQIFKFLRALLLKHIRIANYAFSRDRQLLITIFNRLISIQNNYYAKIRSLELFGLLLQNRYLQKLVHTYTTDFGNFKLIYELAKSASDRKSELVQLFGILRLFILNQSNHSNEKFKEFTSDQYMSLYKLINKVQELRSYTNLVLFTPEYMDVHESLGLMAGKIDKSQKSKVTKIDSDDIIWNNFPLFCTKTSKFFFWNWNINFLNKLINEQLMVDWQKSLFRKIRFLID